MSAPELSVADLYAEQEPPDITPSDARATVQPPPLAYQEDILGAAVELLSAHGVVGEDRLIKLLYLAMTSRVLDRPISVVVKGPSSAGKSFAVERVCDLFPASAFYFLTGMSEHALVYSKEPLVHRVLIVCEAPGMASDLTSYFLRSLLSEGRIRYEVVMKTKDGMTPVLIERDGPTGVILTTTAVSLHPENETRLLSIPATDTAEQTKAVMRAAAGDGDVEITEAPEWRELQEWIDVAEHRVTIPYAVALADAIPPVAVRLRRDFPMILNLIRAHAILHQQHRGLDQEARIVAQAKDYATVRELVVDLIGDQVQATVSSTIRETVGAVAELRHEHDGPCNYSDLGQRLGLDKSAAQRRARVAISRGYLRNEEDRRGKPARLVVGEPLPEEVELLPLPETLSGCTVAVDFKGDK